MDVLERLAGERGGLTSYNLCACTICDAYREIVRLRGQVEALRACMVRYREMLSDEECGCPMDGGVHLCGKQNAEREIAAAVACGAIEP